MCKTFLTGTLLAEPVRLAHTNVDVFIYLTVIWSLGDEYT